MTTFTEKFNQVIQNSGMKKIEVAQILGIYPQTLNKYIQGNSGMSTETLCKFCIAFNISADWLLGIDRGEETAIAIANSNQIRNAVHKAQRALENKNITAEEKQAIIDQLQALIDQLK